MLVQGVSVLVDHKYYQTWVVAVWNIVKYNALGGGGGNGSELYGVEPPTFYVKNLFLNFNVVFLFSLFSVVVRDFSVCRSNVEGVGSTSDDNLMTSPSISNHGFRARLH